MDSVAVPLEGKIIKFGMNPTTNEFDGTLTLDVEQPSGARIPTIVKGSEGQRVKMFPSLSIGDILSVYVRPDGSVQGGITVKEKAGKGQVPRAQPRDQGPTPISKYPTREEQRMLEAGEKQNYILWMACLKNCIEVETRLFAVGGAQTRQDTLREVIEMADAMYEASQRKMRGLPPINVSRAA